MKRVDTKTVYEGKIATVRIDTFENADGSTREREIVAHPGAVAMVAHDDESFWVVRQPREAVGEDSLLELPAGKLDEEGESPLECAQRELAEEIGKRAEEWVEVKRLYTSPGFAAEEVTIFFATGLADADGDAEGDEEDLEVVEVPLTDLDRTIADCADAKSLIGLLLLRQSLSR
jgi:8-oxo-dGTP pyrophosphatase MutT (NUDIX family)